MVAVVYPAGLPAPRSWILSPSERRALRGVRAPSDLARNRGRDFNARVQAEWLYGPEQLAEWLDWYEVELECGNNWFAVNAPGAGGFQTRVARYIGPVTREYVAVGIFRMTAELEVRGLSEMPQRRWVETFNGGTGPYQLSSGDIDGFGIDQGPRDNMLDIDPTVAGTLAEINRTVPAIRLHRLSFMFRLSELKADDGCLMWLTAGGEMVFEFNPRREASFDPTRRARATFEGDGIYATDATIAVNTWYEATMVVGLGAGDTTFEVREYVSGTLVKATTMPAAHTYAVITGLSFRTEQASTTSPTQYDHISIE